MATLARATHAADREARRHPVVQQARAHLLTCHLNRAAPAAAAAEDQQ